MNKEIQLAVTAHQEGKFEEAEQLYRSILKNEPTNLTIRNNFGILLNKLGKFNEAEKIYKKTIEFNPDFLEAHNNLGSTLQSLNKLDEAEASYRKAIELKEDFSNAHYNLANTLKKANRHNEAEASYRKAIELKPDHVKAHSNLGIIQMELGCLDNAERSYKKVIELDPDNAVAYTNLGKVQMELNRFDEALASQEKAVELKPDYDKAHYNLGLTFLRIGLYKKAADEFMLANFNEGRNALLKCWFKLNDHYNFTKLLDEMVERGMNNAVIGSFISRSKTRYGVNKQNPFCNDSLNYVLKTNLTKQCDFKSIFIQPAENILNNTSILNRSQTLLTNGTQSSGNLFLQKNEMIQKMKNIINLEIKKYQAHFKDSEEGFLKNWPKSFYLSGWLIRMKNGGKLSPHMHDEGWLSGSIYINVPKKKNTNSGNLVVCIDENEDELGLNKNPKKIIDVVTGSICLFPSSLLHYTIPFEADEERIVLAFDVMPE